MIRRLRFLSGILTLLASSLFLGEALWAATCAPMAVDGVTAASVGNGVGGPGGAECATLHDADSDGHDDAGCPFTAAASPGSCVAVALGTAPVPTLSLAPRVSVPEISFQSHPDLLLARTLFRPPRA